MRRWYSSRYLCGGHTHRASIRSLVQRRPASGGPCGTALITVSLPLLTAFYPLLTFHLPADFVLEIFGSLRFFFDYIRGKPSTHSSAMKQDGQPTMNFGQAFGVGPAYGNKLPLDIANSSTTQLSVHTRPSYDEDIRLAPYHYGSPTHKRSKSRDSSPPPEHYVYAQ
jgi:hypothetical protein